MLDSQQLVQFVTIVDAGSYRKAAERLYIAQPALTISIQKLERELGVPVFHRTPQGVKLTHAGGVLLEYARRALAMIDAGRRAAVDAASGEQGEFRLGFVGSAAYALLPRVLPEFKRRWPRITLDLQEGDSASLLERLRDEAIDACIVRDPVSADTAQEPGFEVHVIEEDDPILAVPAGHPLAVAHAVSLGDLREEPFIAFSGLVTPALGTLVQRACEAHGFTPHVVQHARRLQTVVSLVACGLGLAIVPGAAASFTHERVRFVPISGIGSELRLRLSLVTLQGRGVPAAGHLLDVAREPAGPGTER